MDELAAWRNRYQLLDQVNGVQRSVGEKNREKQELNMVEAGTNKHESSDHGWKIQRPSSGRVAWEITSGDGKMGNKRYVSHRFW